MTVNFINRKKNKRKRPIRINWNDFKKIMQ